MVVGWIGRHFDYLIRPSNRGENRPLHQERIFQTIGSRLDEEVGRNELRAACIVAADYRESTAKSFTERQSPTFPSANPQRGIHRRVRPCHVVVGQPGSRQDGSLVHAELLDEHRKVPVAERGSQAVGVAPEENVDPAADKFGTGLESQSPVLARSVGGSHADENLVVFQGEGRGSVGDAREESLAGKGTVTRVEDASVETMRKVGDGVDEADEADC